MPKVLVCVCCFEEIEVEEKWLDVPGRMNEVSHLKCFWGAGVPVNLNSR
jgi:hypothetical protein